MCTIAGSDDGTLERTSAPSSSTQEQPWGERQRRGSDASDRDIAPLFNIPKLKHKSNFLHFSCHGHVVARRRCSVSVVR